MEWCKLEVVEKPLERKGLGMIDWDLVEDRLYDAKAITWDTCHKIYVLMDDAQIEQTKGYGYGDEPDSFFTNAEKSPSEMLTIVKKWFDESCGLRFVNAVSTMPDGEDPNLGYETLIEQGAGDECEDCGERGCAGVCNDYDDEPEDDEDE